MTTPKKKNVRCHQCPVLAGKQSIHEYTLRKLRHYHTHWPIQNTQVSFKSISHPRAGGCDRDVGIVTMNGRHGLYNRSYNTIELVLLICESLV